ncbi:MAG: PspC domain-containing protein, partial [Firmicutes bacterium]|nr:PspC domain-containing protein [Bacillota bacterium]
MKRIYRSVNDKKLAGICGGLGEMFNVDPTIIRLALVFLAIITGGAPMIITYIVGWIIIPTDES